MPLLLYSYVMNNRERIFNILTILRKYSDEDHELATSDILAYLKEDNYRKVINQDLKAIEEAFPEYHLNYHHKHGYSLSEAPFSISEIKILIDALDNLKSIDDKHLNKLITKLYSFISIYQMEVIESLRLLNNHEDNHFFYHYEVLLKAYSKKESVLILRKRHVQEEEIIPLFFERNRDHYYLLFNYPNKKKIYRLNFNNIIDIKSSEKKVISDISKEDIKANIIEASDAYHLGNKTTIFLTIKNNDIKQYLKDDFPSIKFYKKEASIDASLNNRFFAKIFAYKNDIEILSPLSAKEEYLKYLKEVYDSYLNDELTSH